LTYVSKYFTIKIKRGGEKKLNAYAENINKRRISLLIPIPQIIEVMGWKGRYTYYNKIATVTSVWSFLEICKMLNILECSYDELFREYPFEDKVLYMYKIRSNPTHKLRELTTKKCLKLPELQKALGTTRQNYYACLANRKLKIYQINNILDLLNCKFEDIFAIKTISRKGDANGKS
jgi:DNA-binding Xre family transcriptional regulator